MNLEEGIVARHLLVEIIGSHSLNEKETMERFLQDLAQVYKSEILALQVYQFQPFGLSALLVMPESHVAVHTWPEHGYAALDIFLKVDLRPQDSIPLIEQYFAPQDIKIRELERGVKKKDGTLVHPGLHQ
ncbi:MAG TPA: adenosylmethionine decarboxylase [Candidatus Atribacteria bacterium]|nr:adenosylmethionine decarboxylase [Candidatus Atribacteria bacterium]